MKRITITITALILAIALLSSCSKAVSKDESIYEEKLEYNQKPTIEYESSKEEADLAPSVEGESRYQSEDKEEIYSYPETAQDTYNLNNEEYGEFSESPFYYADQVPLSTFSIDVDTASYANIRRMLNDGYLPNPDAVRVEECINYFDYDYDSPDRNDPYGVSVEMARCPWQEDNYLVMIGINAQELVKEELPASNLVFLIDVSGSMDDQDKLPLLQSGFKMLTDTLRQEDRISIVTYSGDVSVRLEGVSGDEKSMIKHEIDRLSAGGSTAGGKAMEIAYEIAQENFIEGGNNRIIMATDGDFNVGISSENQLENFIEKKRDEGIFLSMLGFGSGNVKDNKMELLADKGNGNYNYIDSAQEANKVLVQEMASTIYTLAKDVKVQVEFNPSNVVAYRLIGYDNRRLNDEDFNDDTKDAGEMGLGHTVTVLYEIVPQGATSDVDPLRYQDNDEDTNELSQPIDYEWMYIKTKYKYPDKSTSEENIEVALTNDDISTSPSDNFLFSSAVAEFAMILKGSQYCSGSMDNVIDLAKEGRGFDDSGYRSEFIRLAQIARNLLD